MKSGKTRVLAIVLFALLFFVIAGGWLWVSVPPPVIAIPTPNGYDALVEASSSVQQSIMTKDDAKLKEFLALNEVPLKLVDEALQMECVVPIDFNAGMANVPQMPRGAFRLLDARARVLKQDGDVHAAAMEWAEMFAYATKTANGGALVHMLSSVGCESMALNGLRTVVDELSSEEKQEVLAIIESADRKPHDFAAIREREHAIVRGEYGALFATYLIKMTASVVNKPATDAGETADKRVLTELEEVITLLKP